MISHSLGKDSDEDLELFANETTVNTGEMVSLMLTFAKWETYSDTSSYQNTGT
ncbi:hypothetical protein [Paraglaciecola sp. T6c]|uniref:hypothetical protein n=1 Tax=Pseudoalteromonas atlantica (strain T6c / ATCC BAA-1087) TaxID=3042615 RepID=UPI0012EE614B|nr:hypothetical protein [Paraglaciecola sp. T6c]